MRKMLQAVVAGKRVWATVFRKGAIHLIDGEAVKDGELLSWTYEGATGWTRVRIVEVAR